MTYPKKELTVACSYLLRLVKAHVQLSPEQIHIFKQTFHEILSKRFLGHWFPATPHRGSAYRCLQTKYWKDPVLRSIAERSSIPLHRYLPSIFTMWIDPGEVAICFGDEGTWCPLYKHGSDGEIHQSYSDEEDTAFSLVDHEDLSKITDNIQTLNLDNNRQHSSTNQTANSRSSSSLASSSRASSPFSNAMPTNFHPHHPLQTIDNSNFIRFHDQGNQFWSEQQQQLIMSDVLFQEGNF